MNWKLKALIIWVLAVPAFTGFPIHYLHGRLLAAVDYGWIIYGAIVYAAIVLLLGKKIYKITIIIALAITIPLVLLGTLISIIGLLISGWNVGDLMDIIGHYAHLMATMIVVIPLALSMITVLPFYRLESHILQSRHGVGMWPKIVLMFLRVFNHIFYFVIPNIIEVIREEGVLPGRGVLTSGQTSKKLPLLKRLRKITQVLVNIGVESICSAIRFIPLWVDEISMLPDKHTVNIITQNKESSED
ncbi:MAG: hypothetical protein K9L30_01280 [Desulfobacterales bacterium]|nr:hypothetical protein [Desulfobacterales bacterium]